jgi:hypothetical protein
MVAIGHIPFNIYVHPTVSGAWRSGTNHTIEISVPLAEKSKFKMDVNVPEIIFGEPIDVSDGASDFELTWDNLSAIYKFVRYNAVPLFERFF